MRIALALGLVLATASVASAKDDTPNAHQLAKDHPWHPGAASITAIVVKCGEAKTALELRRDARGWMHLTGPSAALITPMGRFLRQGKKWVKADDAAWASVRVQGRALRELFGAELVPSAWRVERRRREDTKIAFVVKGHGTLEFDDLDRVWVAQTPGWRVTALERFEHGQLPAKIAFDDGCVMTRAARPAAPKLPSRADLSL